MSRKAAQQPPASPERMEERIQIVASASFIQRLDRWRREQDDLPSRSEAIRRIVDEKLAKRS